MKKGRLLQLFSIITMAAAGVFGVVSNKSSKTNDVDIESVSAASTACDVYFKAKWSGANITLAKVHYWNGGDYWMDMTEVYVDEGCKVYKYTIPAGNSWFQYQTYTSNWGSGEWHTSVNVAVSQNILCTPAEGWDGSNFTLYTGAAYPYAINFFGNGYTSGSMVNTTGYGNVGWGIAANGFVRTGFIFDSWNTQADGKGTKYSDQAVLPIKSDTNAVNLYAQWRKPYTSGRYLLDENLDMDSATLMNEIDGQHVVTMSLAYQQKIKSAWYNNDNGVLDNFYGYTRIYTGCGAYHYFSSDAADNLVCYARGSYTIYVNNNNISIEVNGALTSEHIAAQLMQYGDNPESGTCQDRFYSIRTAYLGLVAGEKSTFQGYVSSQISQFKKAYDRYTAWAAALGEDPWSNGKANSSAVLLRLNQERTNSISLLIIISVASISAVGGYFLYKKHKENI